jgi:hypothetical protein
MNDAFRAVLCDIHALNSMRLRPQIRNGPLNLRTSSKGLTANPAHG